MNNENKSAAAPIIPGKIKPGYSLILILLPFLCIIFSLCTGRIYIPVDKVISAIYSGLTHGSSSNHRISIVLWTIRLPRILLAALAGAGLSVAGCAFQSLFSNPLATPDTLGVASGSSFGAALALLSGFNMIGVQVTAIVFGVFAVMLTVLSGWKKSRGKASIILAGIMIGSLFSSLVSLVKYTADTESQLPAITYWLMGSLSSAGYKSLMLGAPFIISGIFILWLIRWQLNILPLSEDEAKTSGINITSLRIITVLCATAITASCVSMCGQVGWVGLLIPHICRMKFGNNHLSLLPASVSTGAVFMILVDTAARTVSPSEIPVSILTSIIGAPFFIILMRKNGGWNL